MSLSVNKTKKTNTLTTLSKKNFNKSLKKIRCIGEKEKLKELSSSFKQQKEIVNECEKEDYKYGNENKTLRELIDLIKKENKKNVKDFIELFPFTGIKGISTLTQSHIFEALWNLVFIFQKDNLKSENEKRRFFKKLETLEKETDNISDILKKTKVHESKKSGIADTFFEHIPKVKEEHTSSKSANKFNSKGKEPDNVVVCKLNGTSKTVSIPSCSDHKPIKSSSNKFIFSAKYFKKEKSISAYDIQNIFIEAESKLNDFNIILLIKDKVEFDKRVSGTSKIVASRFNTRLDLTDLDIFYKDLLNDLLLCKNVDDYIDTFEDKKDKKRLQPRFHQEFFINYSLENIKKNQYKFVWGAVPRSGKSYMIGGLVSRLYKEKIRPVKNVIVILGAVSETGPQFKALFEEYSDFNEFEIISIQQQESGTQDGFTKKYNKLNPSQKNIILISQQQLWFNTKDPTDIHPKLKHIFQQKDTIVFFDEIHQGSSPKAQAQMNILTNLIFYNKKINYPFIMVTATFAKPLKRYLTLGGQNSNLIQWRYEDIQYMKEIDNDDVYEKLLLELKNTESEDDEVKKSEILKQLFDSYNNKGITRGHISKEYFKYPKLTIISPNLENHSFINSENKKTIKEDLISKTDLESQIICNIFKATNTGFEKHLFVEELLNYIKTKIYDKLLNKRLKFNVFGKPHTQLWFLPTSCFSEQSIEIKKLNKRLEVLQKNNIKNRDQDQEIKKLKQSIIEEREKNNNVSIEKMTRYLSILMMQDEYFRDNFCVLVIHSTMGNAKSKKMDMDPFSKHLKSGSVKKYDKLEVLSFSTSKSDPCISTKCIGDKELGKCIEREEACAHAQNKSVIILTGMRLRLGISLPCVDVALHMDPISSVDTIYQSMFRVLTERKGKSDGYFIDLLSERFVNFIYEYDDYTNKSKKSIDLDTRKNNILEKLYSFNINGINLVNDKEFSKVYTKLSDNLDLSSDLKFNKRASKLDESNITSLFNDLESSNKEVFDNFYKGIKALDIDYSKKTLEELENIKRKLYKRDKGTKEGININEKNTPDKQDSKEKEETPEDKYNKMKNYIKDLFSLVLIFQEELLTTKIEECNPFMIKEALIKSLNYKLTEDDINKTLCNDDSRIIDCHISYIKNMKLNTDDVSLENKKKIAFIINLFRHNLLKFLEKLNENEILELFKYFCTIRDSFVFLEKNIDNQHNILDKKCMPERNEMNGGGRKKKQKETQLIENETVLETIRKYLSVREEEKKLFGEVFTPIELVCEMLDKLPKEVWKDPKLKWLDPANGIGNYPVVAYYKLMEGLKDVKGYENKTLRSKHIIENMLFMVELNPVNVKVCKKIFKMIDFNVEPNIYNSPFYTDKESELTETWKKKCPIKSFDIIMGNPPYNQGGIKSFKGSGGENTKTIWPLFIIESFEILKQNGFLLFINPLSWLRVSHNVHKLLIEKHIIWLKLWDDSMSKAQIQADIPLSIFVLQNKDNLSKNKTTIVSEMARQGIKSESNIYLNPEESIPLAYHNLFDKISNKIKLNPNLVLSVKATTVKGNGDSFVLPKTYSVSDNFGVDTYTLKEGVKVKFMSKIHPDTEKIKLIIANKRELVGSFIDTGRLGLVGEHKFYILGDNLKLLQKFFNTKIAKILANNIKYGQSFLDAAVFKFIPDVRNIPKSELPEINDKYLAEYFGYSLKEVVGDHENPKLRQSTRTQKAYNTQNKARLTQTNVKNSKNNLPSKTNTKKTSVQYKTFGKITKRCPKGNMPLIKKTLTCPNGSEKYSYLGPNKSVPKKCCRKV